MNGSTSMISVPTHTHNAGGGGGGGGGGMGVTHHSHPSAVTHRHHHHPTPLTIDCSGGGGGGVGGGGAGLPVSGRNPPGGGGLLGSPRGKKRNESGSSSAGSGSTTPGSWEEAMSQLSRELHVICRSPDNIVSRQWLFDSFCKATLFADATLFTGFDWINCKNNVRELREIAWLIYANFLSISKQRNLTFTHTDPR